MLLCFNFSEKVLKLRNRLWPPLNQASLSFSTRDIRIPSPEDDAKNVFKPKGAKFENSRGDHYMYGPRKAHRELIRIKEESGDGFSPDREWKYTDGLNKEHAAHKALITSLKSSDWDASRDILRSNAKLGSLKDEHGQLPLYWAIEFCAPKDILYELDVERGAMNSVERYPQISGGLIE